MTSVRIETWKKIRKTIIDYALDLESRHTITNSSKL